MDRKRSGKRIITRSGRVLKVNRSLGERFRAMKEGKSLRKLNRMRGLPKSRLKRMVWRLNPKHQAQYWFSRDGATTLLKFTGIVVLFLFVLTLGVFAYYRKYLPDIKDISGSNLGGSISYYDRSGKILLWQDYNAVKRVPVQSQDISKYLKDATVAVEDKDFYNHRGFDVKAIGRAALNDVFRRGSTQGGSTITQQLVKLSLDWTQQRTFSRKVKELILAVELERTYTKDEILTGYLNAAPYGSIDYGAQVAASDYFRKSAKDLTLPEAAMLAAIPKSPAIYSPYSGEYFNKQAFTDRYNYVLDQMADQHKITKQQAEDAKKTDILAEVQPQQNNKYAGIQAPYFLLAAKDELITKWAPKGPGGNKIGGWKVITTLDMNLQRIAEETVQKNIRNALNHGADEQALVAEDVKTGQVVALVGGTDFNNPDHGQINYAHSVFISPGSSFKPYDYSALIENNNNVGAGSVLYDVQQPLPGYPCTDKTKPSFSAAKTGGNCLYDYDFRYPGPETLRYALGGSRNVPAVKAMLSAVPGNTNASVNKTISVANDLMATPGAYKCFSPGVDINKATKNDETQCYGASAIGDGAYLHLDQHVNGVASLARMGVAFPSTYILKIYDSQSATKPFYQWKQPKLGDPDVKQAVRPDTAYIVSNMASDPNASYLRTGYYKWHNYNGWRTAIKTGTTNNGFDGLMMAWNTQYAVGSWVGYHTRNQKLSGFMEDMTIPLTRVFMTQALDALKTKPVNWNEPAGIQHLPAYVVSQHIGLSSVEPSPSTDIYPSWYKPKAASTQTVTIDKVSGKQATECTPSLAKQTLGGSSAPNAFSVDIFYPPGQTGSTSTGTAASGFDDVHSCNDQKPSVNLTVTDNNDGTYTFTAFVQAGTHPFNDSQYSQYPGTVNFLVNGQQVGTANVSDPSDTKSITYTPTSGGEATVSAQVIDSVLYDATDQKTVNFTLAAQPPTNLQATRNSGTNTVSFTWSGGAAPYTVYRSAVNGSTDSGIEVCTSPSTTNCSSTSAQPANSTFYVVDSKGNKSSASSPV